MGIDDKSGHPRIAFRSCRRRYMPSSVRCASFPRAGCGKSAYPVRRAGTGTRAKPNRTEATPRKLRQPPPGDYRHCACSRLYSMILVSGRNAPSSRLVSPEWLKAIYARNIRVAPVTSRQSLQNRYPHQFSAQQQTEEPHSNLKSVDKHSG